MSDLVAFLKGLCTLLWHLNSAMPSVSHLWDDKHCIIHYNTHSISNRGSLTRWLQPQRWQTYVYVTPPSPHWVYPQIFNPEETGYWKCCKGPAESFLPIWPDPLLNAHQGFTYFPPSTQIMFYPIFLLDSFFTYRSKLRVVGSFFFLSYYCALRPYPYCLHIEATIVFFKRLMTSMLINELKSANQLD